MPQVIDNKDNKMEEHTSTIIGVCTVAAGGVIGWFKNGLTKTQQAQRDLELKMAREHLTKEDTEKLVRLMNEPTTQKIVELSSTMAHMDEKIDRLLDRPR